MTTKQLEEMLIEEMMSAIAAQDKQRDIVRPKESKKVCRRLISLILAPHLRSTMKVEELCKEGEDRIRKFAREIFAKHVAALFPN